MAFLWFLLLLAWPAAEIWLFVEVGHAVGWLGAIMIVVGMAVAGAVLMRIQGFNTLNRFLEGTGRGDPPVAAMLDGMGILLAGMLLMLPGFLSDIMGLLLFIPPLRRRFMAWVFLLTLRSLATPSSPPRGARQNASANPPPKGFKRADDVIDAEFETLEPRPSPGPASSGPAKPVNKDRR